MFFKSLKSKKLIFRVNLSEFGVSEGPNFFRLENDPKNTWNMFIGSIRNPMQKFGDGSFFFWPPKIELFSAWISDRFFKVPKMSSFLWKSSRQSTNVNVLNLFNVLEVLYIGLFFKHIWNFTHFYRILDIFYDSLNI